MNQDDNKRPIENVFFMFLTASYGTFIKNHSFSLIILPVSLSLDSFHQQGVTTFKTQLFLFFLFIVLFLVSFPRTTRQSDRRPANISQLVWLAFYVIGSFKVFSYYSLNSLFSMEMTFTERLPPQPTTVPFRSLFGVRCLFLEKKYQMFENLLSRLGWAKTAK